MLFLVYRKGSNSMNQPMTNGWTPIAIVEADNEGEAASTTWGDEKPNIHGCPHLAAKVIYGGNTDVWSNQCVYAVPENEAKEHDWNVVLDTHASYEMDKMNWI